MQPAGKFESADFNLFQAIEQAPDAIILASRDGAIKVWNRGAETIFGLRPLRDEAGAVTGAMAVGRDGTARYLADGTLRARILELEAKTNTGS
jgi:PAS domain S-box